MPDHLQSLLQVFHDDSLRELREAEAEADSYINRDVVDAANDYDLAQTDGFRGSNESAQPVADQLIPTGTAPLFNAAQLAASLAASC